MLEAQNSSATHPMPHSVATTAAEPNPLCVVHTQDWSPALAFDTSNVPPVQDTKESQFLLALFSPDLS